MPSFRRALLLVFSCVLFFGCTGTVKTLSELSKLRADLMKEYGEKEVGVNLSNQALTITFVNSPLNQEPIARKAERALKTAEFVTQHYPSVKQLHEIWVGFTRQQTRLVVFHYSESVAFFAFDKDGSPIYQRQQQSGSRQYTTAAYSPELKQTDIVAGNLQLEGNASNGFSVTPHYSLPGNVTAIDPSATEPKSVSFDFSSSSEHSMFPGAPKITFLADQKVVYQTAAQFSTSKFDDNFSEYLSLPVPYAAFRRFTSGNNLSLTIGDREYRFSSQHHDALLEMRAYVKE